MRKLVLPNVYAWITQCICLCYLMREPVFPNVCVCPCLHCFKFFFWSFLLNSPRRGTRVTGKVTILCFAQACKGEKKKPPWYVSL